MNKCVPHHPLAVGHRAAKQLGRARQAEGGTKQTTPAACNPKGRSRVPSLPFATWVRPMAAWLVVAMFLP